MKRIALVALLLGMLFAASGCWGTLNEQYVKAVDSNWKVMGPNYREYVEADESLPAQSKSRRISAIDEFTELVKKAKAKIEE
jgi:hypothetical protein